MADVRVYVRKHRLSVARRLNLLFAAIAKDRLFVDDERLWKDVKKPAHST